MILTFLVMILGSAQAATLETPFWKTHEMTKETVLFIQDGNQSPRAHLLFPVEQILAVSTLDSKTSFAPADYRVEKGSNEIVLTQKSKIPYQTREQISEIKSPREAFYQYWKPEKVKVPLVRHDNFYSKMQVQITYRFRPEGLGIFTPQFQGTKIQRTLKKLTEKELTKVILIGDSISEGNPTEGFLSFSDFLIGALEERFKTKIEMHNMAVRATTSQYGVEKAPEIGRLQPDLVIVAFGMNDHLTLTPKEYQRNIETLMKTVRAMSPSTEFILVSSMLPNPAYPFFKPQRFNEYQRVLKELIGHAVAFADVTLWWKELLTKKEFTDLTSNGLNHPNNFGSRMYAYSILGLLIENF